MEAAGYEAGINRNIVECKGSYEYREYKQTGVLIETSWNVKTLQVYSFSFSPAVLIETSWNVKSFVFHRCRNAAVSINRNIVECKVVKNPGVKVSTKRINRNIVECKVSLLEETFLTDSCINRNIVECKGRYRGYNACRATVLIETSWNVKD